MKINLTVDPNNLREGYLNICPFAEDDKVVSKDIANLDKVVDDGECSELVAMNVLETFPAKEVNEVINNWLKKLKHGGVLVLGFTEFMEVCKAFVNRELTIEDATLFLHGFQNHPWEHRRVNLTMGQVSEVLKNKGLKILKKRVEGFGAVVVGERP